MWPFWIVAIVVMWLFSTEPQINTFLLVSECKKAEEPQSSHKVESDEQKSDDKRKDTWAEAEENEKREKHFNVKQ